MADSKRYLDDMTKPELDAEYKKWIAYRVERNELIKEFKEEIEKLEGFIVGYKSDVAGWENDLDTIADYLELLGKYMGKASVDVIETRLEPKDDLVEWYRKNNPNAKIGRL